MDTPYTPLTENSPRDSFDTYIDSRLNGLSELSTKSRYYDNSVDSNDSNYTDTSNTTFISRTLSHIDNIISKHNPFQTEYSDNSASYDIDNAIVFNHNSLESKSYQRAHYIKEIQYELFLYLSLMSVLFMLCAIYLKKYYFIVPYVFCVGTLYAVYTFHKLILQYSTIISILVDVALILVIIVKGLMDWNYMMFIVSSFMSVLYTMILFRQLQYYYYIPPSSDNSLDQIYRWLPCK